jgi:hypothetical protein
LVGSLRCIFDLVNANAGMSPATTLNLGNYQILHTFPN